MQTLQNTLYVTVPDAYLKLENDTIRIEVEREKRLQAYDKLKASQPIAAPDTSAPALDAPTQ